MSRPPSPASAPFPAPLCAGSRPEVPIGLGGNTFGRTTDAAASHRVLDAFAEAGGVLVDTADTYSDGDSESIIGAWLQDRRRRSRVLVSTKVGNHARFDGLAGSTVTAAVDESLRRLRTDHVDVCFAHYEDPRTPVEESVAAFDALVRAGKVRAVGVSNFTAAGVRAWIDVARDGGWTAPTVLQPHYSLVCRRPFEEELAGVAVRESLAVLPYRALGGGFLSGKYRTEPDTHDRARGPGVRPLLGAAGLRLLDAVEAIAADHGVPAAAVALAWLLHRPVVTAPLVSATSTEQLEELLAAPYVTLADAELARLDAAADELAGEGGAGA